MSPLTLPRRSAARSRASRRFPLALLCAGWAIAPAVQADPGYYVVTVYDNEGLRNADLRYWTVKMPNRPEVVWPEVGFGYGVSSRWYTELFASWIGSSQMPMQLSTLNWQNDVLLTQGELPLDIALHAQLIANQLDAGGSAIEWGPVLQTDVGRTQLNGNVFFDHGYGGFENGPTLMKYQWQIRHRWKPWLHFGAQGFGELGPWDHWLPRDQQSHRAGPAAFTTIRLDDKQAFLVQAAYLFGSVYGRDARMFTMRAQLVF